MRKVIRLGITILFIFSTLHIADAQVQLRRGMTLMGSRFEITLVDRDTLTANKHIDMVVAEIERIENLISEWRPHTQISEVNRNAGIKPVQVDREVFELTKKAIFFAEQSGGAFDISIVALDKVWRFDGSMEEMPTAEAVRKSIALVGYRDIVLDSIASTIFLRKKGMKIGFGSIGKGYAADKGRALMESKGVQAGLVNASGDLSAWGKQLNGKPWAVGVFNPFKPGKMVKILYFNRNAVVSSGNYEKYVEFNGIRYSHIINPKTGYPATGLVSVTVTGPSAEFANGLSTSIMVMGLKEGRKFMKKFPDYKAIYITDKGKIIKK